MTNPPQRPPSLEYQIKAVFLYNFSQFVEWPADAFPKADAPMVIGILGKDPFGEYLDETVRGEKVNGHPLVIKRFASAEDIGVCHILFINLTDRRELKKVFDHLSSKNILTVGDNESFARQGGMVRFFTEKGKTRIGINLEKAKNADLTISSKLLRLAEIISSNGN